MTEPVPVVLAGGPHDGKQITGTRAKIIETVFMMPEPYVSPVPRPAWWRHPVRWLRWQPPPPPRPPKTIQLRYEADGTTDAGRRVFRLTSPWQPYRGPDAEPEGGNIYKALGHAMYAVHPAIRQDPATRWVMNRDWYARIRSHTVTEEQENQRATFHAHALVPVIAKPPLSCPVCPGGPFGDYVGLSDHMTSMADPQNREPSPDDTVLGTRISVTDDGGPPHLENPRYPQGWPS